MACRRRYNYDKTLSTFKEYYKTYEKDLIPPQSMPNDFVDFARAEKKVFKLAAESKTMPIPSWNDISSAFDKFDPSFALSPLYSAYYRSGVLADVFLAN